MGPLRYPSSRADSERTIALARVGLAATALFALWLDPVRPPYNATLTHAIYGIYFAYAAIVGAWAIRHDAGDEMPIVTHGTDIIAFSFFQYFTLAPASPFFVYFVFSMFCGAIRWGWRGTLVTAVVIALFHISLAIFVGPPPVGAGVGMNRFVIWLTYLTVAAGMLVYLGMYESRLRTEIEKLARWPNPIAADTDTTIARILEYGATLMQAGCVLVVWETNDEPALHEALWRSGRLSVRRHPPGALPLLTQPALARATFICLGPVRQARSIRVADASGRLLRRRGVPLHPEILERLDGTTALATAAIETDAIAGRVFFADLGPPTEAVPLTEVVAREIGSSLGQMHAAKQREEIAAREERIRVARDLHDGVLQGLTGVRLELRAMATSAPAQSDIVRDQLVSLERALAMEQRELRLFIAGLEPGSDQRIAGGSSLALRLASVRERLALEWKTPVTLRVAPDMPPVPEPLEQAVPLMIHEAAVNALKHAQPSRVAVDVEPVDGRLRIAVTDDGHGFPFKGHYDHAALTATDVGPRSLVDRVAALGGRLSIDSSERGSRVEMVLTL